MAVTQQPKYEQAGYTREEAERIVAAAYGEWADALDVPIGGQVSEKKARYNELKAACHTLGLDNPADDQMARDRLEGTQVREQVLERLAKQAGIRD
jgi:hypothetical protein